MACTDPESMLQGGGRVHREVILKLPCIGFIFLKGMGVIFDARCPTRGDPNRNATTTPTCRASCVIPGEPAAAAAAAPSSTSDATDSSPSLDGYGGGGGGGGESGSDDG